MYNWWTDTEYLEIEGYVLCQLDKNKQNSPLVRNV